MSFNAGYEPPETATLGLGEELTAPDDGDRPDDELDEGDAEGVVEVEAVEAAGDADDADDEVVEILLLFEDLPGMVAALT